VLDTQAAGGLAIHGGLVRAIGYLAGIIVSLLGIALIARSLGPADFGRFQTIISLLAVVGAITDGGLATLGLREYAQNDGEHRRHLMNALLGLRIALSLVGTAIATLFSALAGYSPELIVGTAMCGLGLTLTVWQTTLTIPLQASLRLVAVSSIDFMRQALTTAVYAALVIAGVASAGTALAVPVGVGIVVLALSLVLIRGAEITPRVDREHWRELLRVSAAFVLASSVGTLYIYTAMLLMSLVAGAEQVGFFAASFRIVVVVVGVPGLLVTAAFPVLARAARDDATRFGYAVSRVAETTLLLGVAATVVTVCGASAIIAVAAGPAFAPAADVLRIHALTILAGFTVVTSGFALLSLHRHRQLLYANIAAFFVSSTLVLILGHRYGARGGATASAAGETTLAIAYAFALWRADTGVRLAPRVVLGAFASGAVAVAVGLASGIPSALAAILAASIYLGAVLLLRAVPQELLELLPRRAP
jgi:O-antigen/teichoic acid export membrane protein